MHRHSQNLARFALDTDFHGAATHLAVNGEALRRYAGVDGRVERLAAKWAINGFNCFHDNNRDYEIRTAAHGAHDNLAAAGGARYLLLFDNRGWSD